MALETTRRRAGEVKGVIQENIKDRRQDVKDLLSESGIVEQVTEAVTEGKKPVRSVYGEEKSKAISTAEKLDAQLVQIVTNRGRPSTGYASVTTQPTLIRPANPMRLSITLVNTGRFDVYLGFDRAVSTPSQGKSGHMIPAGGSFDEDAYDGELWGVTNTGSTIVTYWEI
jgi:hypothetical protein